MTHVQKNWTVQDVIKKYPEVSLEDIRTLRSWVKAHQNLPQYISDEQLVLFLHSCYQDLNATKKCMEEYYRLRLRCSNFFENRDVQSKELQKTINLLHYNIHPVKTPEGYQIVYHKLNDAEPQDYVFNDGFKLLIMMIDAVYATQGPSPGLILLFDLKGVKLGHITRVPILSVKRGLEYLQDAIPVRLKAIHVLNTHPVIDKIMLLIRPFVRKSFLNLLHFHKENDQTVYDALPKECLQSDYDGGLENSNGLHDKFRKEMDRLRDLFVEEETLMFKNRQNQKKSQEVPFSLARLEID